MNMQTLYKPFALLSVVSLILASAITASSASADTNSADAPPGQLTRRGVSGIVVAVGGSDIVVETKFGNVTIGVDSGTIIKSKGVTITLEDINVGDKAGVLLNKPPDVPKPDDGEDDPDVTPPDSGDDTGTDPDVTPPESSGDTSTDPDLTPTPVVDDTGTDPDAQATPTPTPEPTETPTPEPTETPTPTPTVEPPAETEDTGTDPDAGQSQTPTPTVEPPDTSEDTGTDPDLSTPSDGDDTGTDVDVEPTPSPVPTVAPSFRQDVSALRITIVPSKATRKHECVVVTDTGDGTTTVLDEEGNETELEGDEGTEGEDICLITQEKRGGGKKVTGSTSSNTVDARLERLAEKNEALAEKLAEKKAEQETRRE